MATCGYKLPSCFGSDLNAKTPNATRSKNASPKSTDLVRGIGGIKNALFGGGAQAFIAPALNVVCLDGT